MGTDGIPGNVGGDAFKRLLDVQARRDAARGPAAPPEDGHGPAPEGVELRTIRGDRGLAKGVSGAELKAAFAKADAGTPDGRLDAAEFDDLMAFVAEAKAAKAAPSPRALEAERRFLAELPALVAELGQPLRPPATGLGAFEGDVVRPSRLGKLRAYLNQRGPEAIERNLALIGAVAEAATRYAGQPVQARALRILAREAGVVPRTAVGDAAAEALRAALAGPTTRSARDAVAQSLLLGDRGALAELAPELAGTIRPGLERRLARAQAEGDDVRPKRRFTAKVAIA